MRSTRIPATMRINWIGFFLIFAAVFCAVVENDELCCEENEELGDDSPFPFYKKLDKKSRKTKDSFLISINPTIVSGNTYG